MTAVTAFVLRFNAGKTISEVFTQLLLALAFEFVGHVALSTYAFVNIGDVAKLFKPGSPV
jgi:hypothetical protein